MLLRLSSIRQVYIGCSSSPRNPKMQGPKPLLGTRVATLEGILAGTLNPKLPLNIEAQIIKGIPGRPHFYRLNTPKPYHNY